MSFDDDVASNVPRISNIVLSSPNNNFHDSLLCSRHYLDSILGAGGILNEKISGRLLLLRSIIPSFPHKLYRYIYWITDNIFHNFQIFLFTLRLSHACMRAYMNNCNLWFLFFEIPLDSQCYSEYFIHVARCETFINAVYFWWISFHPFPALRSINHFFYLYLNIILCTRNQWIPRNIIFLLQFQWLQILGTWASTFLRAQEKKKTSNFLPSPHFLSVFRFPYESVVSEWINDKFCVNYGALASLTMCFPLKNKK